jgi:hypothetical protein
MMADLHPAVQAVLDVTPQAPDNHDVVHEWDSDNDPVWGDPTSIAAHQAVAVILWAAQAASDDARRHGSHREAADALAAFAAFLDGTAGGIHADLGPHAEFAEIEAA